MNSFIQDSLIKSCGPREIRSKAKRENAKRVGAINQKVTLQLLM